MDRKLRNDLRLAVIRCRTLLTEDYSRQLEGSFGISANGLQADESALPQLDATGIRDRRAIVAALGHLQAEGIKPREIVERFVREAAFSTLNRLVALKLMEAPERRLVPESIGAGTASRGYRQFLLLSPEAVRAEPDGGYRLYLDLLCGDLAQEIGVLFDLRAPQGLLFPAELALRALLDELNAAALALIWAQDETLGWVYQYFTPKELRDKARKESSAPRDANELAFLNQFYTPHYVVEFLTENTLGRIWYEQQRGQTTLADPDDRNHPAFAHYMVRRKHPIWLSPSESPPAPFQVDDPTTHHSAESSDELGLWVRPNPDLADWHSLAVYALTVEGYNILPNRSNPGTLGDFVYERLNAYRETGKWVGTFAELRACLFMAQRAVRNSYEGIAEGDDLIAYLALNRAICDRWDLEVEVIPSRPKKDPRDFRILDPACGSGHFLLYAFELLLTIYREAWANEASPRFSGTGRSASQDFPDETAFLKAVPDLILRHNLHGIDIDLRAVQIAQLALWLRAQRAWAELDLRPADRPRVTRLDVVAAEPLPGERDLLADFRQTLDPPVMAELVTYVWEGMVGVGEIGSLLKAETLVKQVVADSKKAWQSGNAFNQVTLFAGAAPPHQERLDLSFIDDDTFWHNAEGSVRDALGRYAANTAALDDRYRRRLFADDAAQGFAFLQLFDRPFDVVLMNPPFGAVSHGAKTYVERYYPRTKNDLFAAFVERGLEILLPRGYLGAITSRTGFFLSSFQTWREELLLPTTRIHAVADLGQGVLDTAMVETAAYTLEKSQ